MPVSGHRSYIFLQKSEAVPVDCNEGSLYSTVQILQALFLHYKNTGNIKQQTQYDIDHVGQVLYKYAKMCHNRTASEREQKQGQHDRDHVQNIKADRHAVNDHHNDHDAKRDQHFKAVYKHANYNQNVFRQIYFCHNGLVVFDDFYALLKGLIKEIPHRQTDKNEDCKILLFCIKYHTKDQGVDQHETDRINTHHSQFR